MSRLPAAVLAGVMLLVTSPLSPSAQSPAPAAGDAQTQATLVVRLTAGKATYVIGELIPVELEFAGKADADYYFSTESYDRSGRLWSERYELTPATGFVDPLDELYRFNGVMGGGAASWHPLDGTPFIVRVHLNEWFRFTEPGRYQLVVSSRRLGRYSRQPVSTTLRSAPIEVTIARPDDAWTTEQLHLATAALDSGNRDRMKDGATRLRHLGTAAAALELVARYVSLNDQYAFDVMAGLIGSPHRAAIVAAMEAQIDAGTPIAGRFVEDLSFLKVLLEQPRDTPDPAARFERQRALAAEYHRRWTTAFTGRGANPASMEVALKRLAMGGDTGMTATMAAFVAADPGGATTAFFALPAMTQRTLIEYRWPDVRAWIRPVLDRLLDASTRRSGSERLGDLALRRILELDPAAGRRLVLDEIATGAHGIGFDALATLPDAALPELEAKLVARFETSAGLDDKTTGAWLLWRYASAAALPVVQASIDRPWACSIEAGLTAYLLKHQPALALARLSPAFDRRARGGCVVPPVGEIARRAWDTNLEKATVALLEAPEVRVVAESARLLGQYGSAAVKAPLLDRLTRWEAQWRGKAAALDYRPGADSAVLIENAITMTLLESRQFTVTADELTRIRSLCVSDGCRTNVDARIRNRR